MNRAHHRAGRRPKSADDQRTIEDCAQSIVREANASDVSFYIWNVEGLVPPATAIAHPDRYVGRFLARQGDRRPSGHRQRRRGAVQEFDTASSTFYSLGYSPAHPDDGKYHAISVRLKRKGRLLAGVPLRLQRHSVRGAARAGDDVAHRRGHAGQRVAGDAWRSDPRRAPAAR